MLTVRNAGPFRYGHLSDRVFTSVWDEMFADDKLLNKTRWKKRENDYFLSLEIPGYGREDIEIIVKERVIRIKSLDGKLEYAYSIPKGYDLAASSAKVDKGILELSVPVLRENEEAEVKISIA